MTGLKSGSGDDLWDDEEGGGEETADDEPTAETAEQETPELATGLDEPDPTTESSNTERPYIVRRAVQNKPIQFERDERLTFFVHDDVVDGERQLISAVESALGRDIPKFDVREAVYRAALDNPDDVLSELVEMGYALDDE